MKLLISDINLETYYSLGESGITGFKITPKETNLRIIIWNKELNKFTRIFPLVVTEYSEDEKNGEALFLEEIKGKRLTYLFKDGFIQRK